MISTEFKNFYSPTSLQLIKKSGFSTKDCRK